MVKLHYAILNAFTLGLDTGNPAAVIVLPTPSNPPSLDDRNSLWAAYPSDETLQKVATELGQPMTAFLLPLGVAGYYALRWFNVNMEAFLCGHATMALSYYLLEVVGDKVDQLVLETKHHGAISSTPIRADGRTKIVLNFPELRGFTTVNKVDEQYASIIRSLGVGAEDLEDLSISETYALLEFKPPVDLTSLTVDYDQLKRFERSQVLFTQVAPKTTSASGSSPNIHARVFGVQVGNEHEDAVTGSAHCALIPYYVSHPAPQARLAKVHGDLGVELNSYQQSKRGGTLTATWLKDEKKVQIVGDVVLVKEGDIEV